MKSNIYQHIALWSVITFCGVCGMANAAEIKVLASGGFRAAYLALAPGFERASGHKVESTWGGSMGSAPTTIPNRLQRGEVFDVVIMARDGLADLARQGKVTANSQTDLARSMIGVAVRAGAPVPDISTVDAFKRTLTQAQTVSFSSSASGVYLIGLFERLGMGAMMKRKSKQASREPVGELIARGDADIGFQQISELLPVKGITYVGPLPAEIQEVTVFSGGIAANAPQADAARALLKYLSDPANAAIIRNSGMEPM
jgi:molybdate transport system substrate-binding protein